MTEDEKKLAAELFARREEEDEWSDKPEELKVSRPPSVVYSIRLSRPELEELRAAADAEGISLAELIRRSALTHVREEDTPNASVSRVGKGLVLVAPNLVSVLTRAFAPEDYRAREDVTSASPA